MTEFFSVDVSTPDADGLRFATLGSSALGRRADVSFYVDEDAAEGAPVVILLHGVLGSHWGWALHGRAHVRLRGLIRAGRVRPVVLLMPSDGLWGTGSGYVPHPGEDAQGWIRDEMPAFAALIHPGAGAAGTCIGGLSMGGFGALRLAAKHPDRYVAAAGTSSVMSLGQLERITGRRFDAPESERRLADLIVAAGARMPPFRLDCGTADDLLKSNRQLHETLEGAGIDHEYFEYPGAHEWPYWIERIDEIFLFFERHLASYTRR